MRVFLPLLLVSDAVRMWARRRRSDRGHSLGADGEDIAHRLLQDKGMTVVARNWRTKSGWAEVDIVAWTGSGLVFVEVKSRRSGEDSAPDREITPEKRRKISIAAREFKRETPYEKLAVRFDVVTVVFEPRLVVNHYVNAWSEGEALAARAH